MPEDVLSGRLLLLYGEEETLRRRALFELIHRVAPDGDDYDLENLDAGDRSPADWLAATATIPFLSERRVVVVRNLLRADPPESSALGAVPDHALLVLVADESGGDEQKLARSLQKWQKAVQGAGGRLLGFDSDPKQLASALSEELSRLGKTMSPSTLQVLTEMVGGSLSRGVQELEKLALYVGDAPAIRETDVRAVTVPSREWNVFALIDAVLAGEAGGALRHLRVLVGTVGKPEEAAFQSLFPLLTRAFRLLWQARLCVEAGVRQPASAPEALRSQFPDRPNLAKEKDYAQQKAMRAAQRVDLDTIAYCLRLLSDADARIKGLLPGYSTSETLERMVFDMIDGVRGAAPRLA